MAIDRTGISSLDTGASDITYSGDEGPKSPDQMLMASADPMLVDEYNKYVFEMEEQGMQPISFREFVEQVMAESKMAEGGIASLGYASGQLVKSGPGRPGYQGPLYAAGPSQGPAGGQTMTGGGSGQFSQAPAQAPAPSGQGNIHFDPVEQARAQAAQVAAAKANLAREEEDRRIAQSQRLESERIIAQAKALNEQERLRIENDPRIPQHTKTKLIGQIQPPMLGEVGGNMDYMGGSMPAHLGDTGGSMNYMGSTMPAHLGDTGGSMDYMLGDPFAFEDAKTGSQQAAQLAAEEEWAAKSPGEKERIQARWDLGKEQFDTTGDGGLGDGTGGDGGLGGTGANVPGTPIVPEGITAAESAQSFQDAKAAAIAEA